ncbi:Uncharacterised protein [Chlamydia trachomatis]|nr:Uncharacterised protein [Chlamydia trachomatis]
MTSPAEIWLTVTLSNKRIREGDNDTKHLRYDFKTLLFSERQHERKREVQAFRAGGNGTSC